MIKVGILGAAVPIAGEIIRILVHHTEVELACLYAPSLSGHSVTSVHHGLWGEQPLSFTENPDIQKLDVAIICEPSDVANAAVAALADNEKMRIVDLTGEYGPFEFGLSEMNRKPLVRGARAASVPTPIVSIALIALYPFAASLMLNDDIRIEASGYVPGDECEDAKTIAQRLATVQNSFASKVSILKTGKEMESERGVRLRIAFPSTLTVQDAQHIYDKIYDDHNFTFLTPQPLVLNEVEGTHKCLINISKPASEEIVLDVVADATMRGGAGEAVHLLNLLFGLHERTGLNLKISRF